MDRPRPPGHRLGAQPARRPGRTARRGRRGGRGELPCRGAPALGPGDPRRGGPAPGTVGALHVVRRPALSYTQEVRMSRLCPLLLLGLAASAGAEKLPLVFEDDFTKGADRWKPTD